MSFKNCRSNLHKPIVICLERTVYRCFGIGFISFRGLVRGSPAGAQALNTNDEGRNQKKPKPEDPERMPELFFCFGS